MKRRSFRSFIKWLKIGLASLMVVLAGFGIFVYFFLPNKVNLPPSISEIFKKQILSQFGVDIQFADLELNTQSGNLTISSFSARVPAEKPFLCGDFLNLNFGEGIRIWTIFRGEHPIEFLVGKKLSFDQNAPLPKSDSGKWKPFQIPEIKKVNFENFKFISSWGEFDCSALSLETPKPFVSSFSIILAGNPFEGSGQIKGNLFWNRETSWVNLQIKGLNAGKVHAAFFLKLLLGIPEFSGSMDLDVLWRGDIGERLAEPMQDLKNLFEKEISGTVKIAGGKSVFKDIPFEFSGSLKKTPEEFYEVTTELGVASGTIFLQGKIADKKKEFVFEGNHLFLEEESLKKAIAPFAPASFKNLSLKGKFTQWPENAFTEGRLFCEEISSSSFLASRTEILWKGCQSGLAATFSTILENASLSGELFLPTPLGEKKFDLTGEFLDLDIRRLDKFLLQPLSGVCRGRFNASGTLAEIRNTRYFSMMEIRDIRFNDIVGENLSFNLSGIGENWEISDLVLRRSSESWAELSGKISPLACRGLLKIAKIPISFFGLKSDFLAGEINFSGNLDGKLNSVFLKGEAWSEKFKIGRQFFAPLKSHLEIDRDKLTLNPIIGNFGESAEVEGQLLVNLIDGKILNLQLNFHDLDLSKLSEVFPKWNSEFLPRGRLSGFVSKRVFGEKSRWNFNIGGNRLSVASENLDSLQLEGEAFENEIRINRFSAKCFKGSAELNGRVSMVDRVLHGSLKFRDISLKAMNLVQEKFPGFSGIISCDGEIFFDHQHKKGILTFFGKKLASQHRPLGNLGAEIKIEDERMIVTQAVLDDLGINFTGEVQFDKPRRFSAKVTLKETDLGFIPPIYGWTSFQQGDLTVGGNCEIEGELEPFTLKTAKCNFPQFEISRGKDLIVSNKPIDFCFQNGSFEFRSFELKFRNGIFCVEGIWNPRESLALTLSGENFSIAALANLADIPNFPFDGNLSIDGGVFGKIPDVRMNADLLVKGLTYKKRVIPKISAKCQIDTVGINVQPLIVDLPKNQIVLNGILPFKEGGNFGEMDVQINVASGPLNDFSVYLPEIFNAAKGHFAASMRLFGHPKNPAITGNLSLEAEELGFKGMKKPLKNVVLAMKTQEGILNIDPLKASLGKGLLQGSGSIDFRDSPGSMTIAIFGKNLDLAWGRVEIFRTDAAFTGTGNLYNPVIRGKIKIPKGRVRLSDDLLAKADLDLRLPLQSLDYKIDFEVPRNFWLRNSMLNAEMRGKFNVNGDLRRINLEGSLQTVQGWLFFQRRKFLLENGEVRFGTQDGKLDPHFFLKSSTNVQNTQIFLTLEGRLSSFTPQLYSSPPMAENDLFALIAFGRNVQQTQSTSQKDLLEKEILDGLKNTYFTGLLSSTLSHALNLDELFMGSLFDRTIGVTRSFLRVGKYMGNNVFLAYEGTLSNEGQKSYIVEYRLPKGFFLNLEMERPINRNRIGIKYNWKF